VLLAQSFHPVMLGAVLAGQTGAWLAALLSGVLASAAFWAVTASLRTLPGGDLMSLARFTLGRPGAIGTSLLVAGVLVYHSGFVVRQTAEMAVSAVYPLTPQTFAVVALLACVLGGAYAGMNALVRLCRAFFPFLLLAILFIVLGVFGWGEVRNLLPLWGPGPGPLLVRSVMLLALYTPGLFLLMTAGQVQDPEGLWRAAAMAGIGSGTVYALALAMLIMTYTYPLANSVAFPLHEMARLILGGRFFQRVEGLWVLIWVWATVCHVGVVLHVAAAAIADAFEMDTHRIAVPPLTAMVLTLAYFPVDQAQAVDWHTAAAPFGLLAGFAVPLLLSLIAMWQRRRKKRAA